MNVFEEALKDISNQVFNILEGAPAFDDINDFLAKAEKEIANFEKTGSFHVGEGAVNIKRERITNVASTDGNSKENVDSARNRPQPVRRTTRTAALEDGLNNLNIAKTLSVKLERISELNSCGDINEMPPPQEPIRKGRVKKAGNIVIKKEKSANSERDSDVIFQPAHISIISLTDTEEEMKQKPTRSTRTKTRAMTAKKDEMVNEKNTHQTENEKNLAITENFEKPEKEQLTNNNDSKEPQTVHSNDTGDNMNEKPIRSTRTKTRAMAPKQNKEDDKDFGEKDSISQSNVENGQSENITQKVATGESENVDNNRVDNKSSVSSEEEGTTKLKKKGKKQTVKRVHSLSPLHNEGKRQKSSEFNKNAKISDETFVKSPHKENKTDAINQTVVISKPADATVVLDKPTVANETVIVPKDKRILVTTPLNKQVNLSDLMTDDEDDRTYSKTTNKKPGKPIFNGFENSPVKKRVEAFEKLGAQQAAKDSSKLTKKTKPKPNKDEEEKSRKDMSLKPTIKSKVKMFTATPLKSVSKVPVVSESASKTIKPSFKEVMLPPKSASALKAYQQDFIERELRRQEKELEATRKREALLQAKKHESKRKREEKQQRVQQTREALGKTKQEMQEEMDKMQSRKYKQMLAEKSSKVAEQKGAVAEQKCQVEKKGPPFKTPTKQIKSTPVKKVTQKPIYLEMTPPLLPLEDCYDSDDERNVGKANRPDWTRRYKMYSILHNISFSPSDVINTFYMRKAATPDLQLLFGRINPSKLKRTSSAIWNKPPRFTIMPIPNEEDEDDLS